ncbi:MAG: VWA domain-containing protein [Bacteroidota bacterium]
MLFRFEYSEHLYALLAIPVLVVFFVLMRYARKRALAAFGDHSLVQQLMPQMSRYKHGLKFVLLMLAVALLAIGWANPQWGSKKEKVKRKSVDIFIALDISRSMMVEDIRPNRLERAKLFAQKLVKTLKGDRIGLIIFAGNAYLQMPLTTDYAAAQLFIKSANPRMAPSQGTAIVDAIELAERSFEEDNKQHKAMILITDGENHDDEALTRAEEAYNNGLLIFSVGVGTSKGDFIPMRIGGRQDFKRDNSGNPIISRLNEEMLGELSEAGGGAYHNLLEEDKILPSLRKGIEKIEKREFEQRVFTEFESYFQYFIAAALLLILLEFGISYRKSQWASGTDLFETRKEK